MKYVDITNRKPHTYVIVKMDNGTCVLSLLSATQSTPLVALLQ